MRNLCIREGIVCVMSDVDDATLIAAITADKVIEAYLVRGQMDDEEKVIWLAHRLKGFFAIYNPLIEQVVVGPISPAEVSLIERYYQVENLRTTDRSFDEYCVAKANHIEWSKSVRPKNTI